MTEATVSARYLPVIPLKLPLPTLLNIKPADKQSRIALHRQANTRKRSLSNSNRIKAATPVKPSAPPRLRPEASVANSIYSPRDRLVDSKSIASRGKREITLKGTRIAHAQVIYQGDSPVPVMVDSDQISKHIRNTSCVSYDLVRASPSPTKRLKQDRTEDASMSQHSAVSEQEESDLSAPNSS